MSTYVSLILEG